MKREKEMKMKDWQWLGIAINQEIEIILDIKVKAIIIHLGMKEMILSKWVYKNSVDVNQRSELYLQAENVNGFNFPEIRKDI